MACVSTRAHAGSYTNTQIQAAKDLTQETGRRRDAKGDGVKSIEVYTHLSRVGLLDSRACTARRRSVPGSRKSTLTTSPKQRAAHPGGAPCSTEAHSAQPVAHTTAATVAASLLSRRGIRGDFGDTIHGSNSAAAAAAAPQPEEIYLAKALEEPDDTALLPGGCLPRSRRLRLHLVDC